MLSAAYLKAITFTKLNICKADETFSVKYRLY